MRLGVVLMVVLDGASLTIDALAAVAEGREEVVLAPAARDPMAAAREVVEEALRLNVSVYGLTTALAERKSVGLDAAARQGFRRFLIGGHRIAQGPPAAEARMLAQPVSFEVVSSGKADGIEDRGTMGPLSARRLAEMADLAARVVSLELFVAAQAIDLRRPSRLGRGNRASVSPGARTRRLHRPRTDPSGRSRATCRCGPGGPVRPGGQLRLTGHVP